MVNQESAAKRQASSHSWRDTFESSLKILIPVVAVLLAFVVGSLVILAKGANPIQAYAALFKGAFGGLDSTGTTIRKATPLLLTGLAVVFGYRGGVFNIGAEGQLILGGMAATAVGVRLQGAPTWLHLTLCILAAMAAGSLWSALPGALKAFRGFNEVITTLMMNYIAVQVLAWSVRQDVVTAATWKFWQYFGLKDGAQPFAKSATIFDSAKLPVLWPAMRLNLGAVIAVLAAILVFIILWRTTFGFALRTVGSNPRAAKYAGIRVPRTMLTTMLISGALAGLAGGIEILGNQGRIIDNFLINVGFDGIPVALVGQLHPFGAILSALFFGGLRAGSNTMQIMVGVPISLIYILQALAILFAIAGTSVNISGRFARSK
jgi:general nucleoside transport system permease protein